MYVLHLISSFLIYDVCKKDASYTKRHPFTFV